MVLAGAGRAQEHHVLGLVQEVQLSQMDRVWRFTEALEGEVEVEVVEGLYLGEPGRLDPVLATMGSPGLKPPR